MKTIRMDVELETMQEILNGGRRLLYFDNREKIGFVQKGDAIIFLEKDEFDYTGKKFFGIVLYVTHIGCFQFELKSFMEEAGERIPMTGDYPHEKLKMPEHEWYIHTAEMEGGKPVWVYDGVKWSHEINFSRLTFLKSRPGIPSSIQLKIENGSGAEFKNYHLIIEEKTEVPNG